MSKNEQKLAPIFLSFLFIFLIFVIYFVFSGRFILPQSFPFGPIILHYYGLIMALAVGVGFQLAKKRAPKFAIDPKTAEDVVFWLIIGGFIGARVYHVLSAFGYYQDHPIAILKVWQGGLSIYGAVLGGLLSLYLFWRLNKDSPWRPRGILVLLGWLTPPLIFGQIIGRFGNLFNYEAFGYPTNLPWKMFVPENFRPFTHQNSQFFHPWFLYEQIGLLIIFLIIRKIEKTKNWHPEPLALPGYRASLFLWYFLLYNTLRFGLEFLRIDSTFISGFRLNSLISLTLILISAALLVRRSKVESV